MSIGVLLHISFEYSHSSSGRDSSATGLGQERQTATLKDKVAVIKVGKITICSGIAEQIQVSKDSSGLDAFVTGHRIWPAVDPGTGAGMTPVPLTYASARPLLRATHADTDTAELIADMRRRARDVARVLVTLPSADKTVGNGQDPSLDD